MEKIIKETERFYFTHRRSPSITELADAVGRARSTEHGYLREMNEKKMLSYDGESITMPLIRTTNMNAVILTAEEKRKRLELCAKETEGLALRDIRCPNCNYLLARVFSDVSGHFLAKCQKCKRKIVLNLAYFL